MPALRIGAVAAHFGRDVPRALAKIEGIVADARAAGVGLLVLPDATLGGYLSDLRHPDPLALPPALEETSWEVRRIVGLAREMVVCFGYAEEAVLEGPDGLQPVLHNTALCVSGDGVLGRHRKVHQPAGESLVYAAGDGFGAFDTPVGRLGLLIDYDKTFPEAARSLALDGAGILACLSAWPASVTDRASRLPQDRQSRLFDLYDAARAAENQVVWVSANQTGVMGGLRFLGQAKVVGPGGDVLARTSSKGGLAVAEVDVEREVARARRLLHHLAERRPAAYGPLRAADAAADAAAGAAAGAAPRVTATGEPAP
ncbi:carbon-nitrogen hydrolase family protein [Nocardioides sp. ChNu-153]|uniref:carbon-nitrogen hydrolase family protein n=1 Tax=unclassified Nocardioides TaxID=2615069 RepID=UPI002407599A|nr:MULTISPECIES: carbon-nitrogen hydrolase family protein [unclassified Nocardioides]MDF9717655.1 carbon-nitrogen hydrolase family protein [Nocardioides sp. ChNu-99]MDN7123232.1 carbon-nitrogen hydrolase family protein [Nocardioides sp. ChNu-153]